MTNKKKIKHDVHWIPLHLLRTNQSIIVPYIANDDNLHLEDGDEDHFCTYAEMKETLNCGTSDSSASSGTTLRVPDGSREKPAKIPLNATSAFKCYFPFVSF